MNSSKILLSWHSVNDAELPLPAPLTSSWEERDSTRDHELGANAYVVKPVAFEQFVEAVRERGLFWVSLNESPPGSA